VKRKATDADMELVARSTGLMSQEEYARTKEEVEKGTVLGLESEKPTKKKKKKQKKKETGGQGALSFEEEEGEQIAFKKKSNPDVKPGSLVKSEWMTAETKELLAQEALERLEAVEKVNAELRKRELSISYKITLAPIGGESVYATGYNQSGIVPEVEGLPPREFKGLPGLSEDVSYGTTVKDTLKLARGFLSKRGTTVDSQLLLICGSPGLGNGFILTEEMDFLALEQAKYHDKTTIFRMEEEGEAKPRSEFWVMSKDWYEATRYHFPQSSWKVYDSTVTYLNPLTTKTFQAVGSEDEVKQFDICQGVPEAYIYGGAVTGKGTAMGR